FVNCRFSGNRTQTRGGGGLWTTGGTCVNCLLDGNQVTSSTQGYGGGQYGSCAFYNCTVVANSSYGWPPGPAGAFGSLCVNTILWGNDNGQVTQAAQGAGGAPNHCCIQGWDGSLGGVGN